MSSTQNVQNQQQQQRRVEIATDSIKDKLELSPIEKYIKFNKFPYKFLIHTLLIIFTTIQTINMVGMSSTYQKPIIDVFKYILLNSTDEDFTNEFYTVSDYQSHLQNMVQVFQNLDAYMLNGVDTSDSEYDLEVYYADTSNVYGKNRDLANTTYKISIDQGIVGPFDYNDPNSLKHFVQSIEYMNFNARNVYTIAELIHGKYDLCYNWTIKIQYNFIALSHIEALLLPQASFCQQGTYEDNSTQSNSQIFLDASTTISGSQGPFGETLIAVHFIVLFLAIASLVLAWVYVYETGLLYMSARKSLYTGSLENQMLDNVGFDLRTEWEDLSLTEKFKFFDIWFFIIMLGNIFQILGSIISIYEILFSQSDHSSVIDVKQTFIGLGCMAAWLSIIKYLAYNPSFRATTNILSLSSSNFFKFLIGVIPLFLGFVFLGRCLFWKYQKFESTNAAIVALFSIMAGDIIDETYTDTDAEGILSDIYITAFIILFMAAVHNVFISIISEGFRNKFLEDRYQQLFNMYALGPQTMNIDEKKLMNTNMEEEIRSKKKDPLAALMPFLRNTGDINFDPEYRKKLEQMEIERIKIKQKLNEKTKEIEKLLEKMKEVTNEFCEDTLNKEDKRVVRKTFQKCLQSLYSFIKSGLQDENE